MYEGPELVQALLAAGMRGYLLKGAHWQELVAAIRTVSTDSERVVLGVCGESLEWDQAGPWPRTLSAREREVLALVGEAFSNGQIATRLSLTEATVDGTCRNIFVKLGASPVSTRSTRRPNSACSRTGPVENRRPVRTCG